MSALSPRPATRRRSPEHDEQAALIRWRDMFAPTEPELKWLHASLNGVKLTKAQAGKAKAAGMTPGVWDLFLPVPNQNSMGEGWCGLYIEMKVGRNVLTSDQVAFRDALALQYRFDVCRSWAEAALTICQYLRLPESHPARRAAQ